MSSATKRASVTVKASKPVLAERPAPVRYFSLDQVAHWRPAFCKKWLQSTTGGKVPAEIVTDMVIPPLDVTTMKAGEWLLSANAEGLKKAGLPEKYMKQVLLSLQRFRIKCATVNAQCLLKSRLKHEEYVRSPKPKPGEKSAADDERMWKMRDLVAHDVMNTEITYNKQLHILDDLLYVPLLEQSKKKNPVLTEEELRVIFSDIQVIHTLSTSFLASLQACFQNWDNKTSRLGTVFKGMVQFFRAYADYVRNYDKAISFLASMPRNSRLSAFFKKNVTDDPSVGCNLTLSSLLVVPVQRIPRYPLLLKDVIKYTPVTHPDYNSLQEALEGIQKIADWVNECIRTNQSQRECMKLQMELVGFEDQLMVPSRLFVKEGEVVELSETEKPRRRVFLLFNDILIIADPKYDGAFFSPTSPAVTSDCGDGLVNVAGGDFGTVHGTKKLKPRFQFVVSRRLTDIELESEPPFSGEFSACFALKYVKGGSRCIYAAENVAVRDEWTKALEEQISQQADLENKTNELREKAAQPKAEQVKAVFGAQYFSLTSPLTARTGRKKRDVMWRTLSAEEKNKMVNDAKEYVKLVQSEAGKPKGSTVAAEATPAQFETFSMAEMKNLRSQSVEGKAESLRIRSRSDARRPRLTIDGSESTFAFDTESEMSATDSMSEVETPKASKEKKKHHDKEKEKGKEKEGKRSKEKKAGKEDEKEKEKN